MSAFYSLHWPTRTHVIPYRLFARLVRALENLDANVQLLTSRGVATGIATAMSTDPKVRWANQQLAALANPTERLD